MVQRKRNSGIDVLFMAAKDISSGIRKGSCKVDCQPCLLYFNLFLGSEKQAQFDARVAKFPAEYVAQYIKKLNCPTEQKLKLIDAIAETIMEIVHREEEKQIHQ